MRKNLGIICIVIGTVLILGALSLFLWNRHEDFKAECAVNTILPDLEDMIDKPNLLGELPDDQESGIPYMEIDGQRYIGYISIPKFGLRLPVMITWSYENLKLAPCRYYGSVLTDDLVIAAHNYRRHFGKLYTLSAGDEVLFTNAYGEETQYQVQKLDTLQPAAIDEMTAGDYDLTLFTCTYGGRSRVTVRCNRTER